MARQKLNKAIHLHSKILLNKKAQTLVVKLILIAQLSPRVAYPLLQKIGILRAMKSATSV